MQAAYPSRCTDSGSGALWRRWLRATTPEAPPESSSWAIRDSARRARLVAAFATLTGLGYALVLLILRIAEPSLSGLPLLAPIAACAIALMLNRAGRGALGTAVFLIPGLAVNLWICTGEGQSIGIDGIFGFHWLILATLIATMLMPRWVPYAFALTMGVTVGVLTAYIPLAPDLRAAIAAQGLLATKSWIGFVWGLYYCLFFCVGALMGHVATTTLERAIKQADRTEEVEALHALSERRRRQAEEAERALRLSEEQLIHAARHDSLTGLPNRAFFNEQLGRLIRSSAPASSPLCVLLLDLDRFKEVNDTLGHHTGDELLREAAARLRGSLRATDLAARLGGDEFAVALPDTSTGDATVVARTLLAALAIPVEIEGRKMEVGCSIGIATYPEHGGDSATYPERGTDMAGATLLLRHADAAMYRAKRRGGGYATHNADAPDAACQPRPEGRGATATSRDAA